MDKVRENTAKIFRFFMIIFFILGLYTAYIQVIKAKEFRELMKKDDSPRSRERVEYRGKICARDGTVLAISKKSAKPGGRAYPMKEISEPMLGYLSLIYNKGGLEEKLDKYLRAQELSEDFWGYILRRQPRGQDVYLTIDAGIQTAAVKALGDKKGAVIVMNPGNGEILAMASNPAFKPEQVEARWNQLTSSSESPFLLRPVNGSYPPGSVFKLLTLAACLEEGIVTPQTVFNCPGSYPISYYRGDYYVTEAGGAAYGSLTAEDALVYSSNVAFAQMGLKLKKDGFLKYLRDFGFQDPPDFELRELGNILPDREELTDSQLAQCAFGQGVLSVTPFSIALMVSAFANKGEICQPRIIKSRVDENGNTVYKVEHTVWKSPVTSGTAKKVHDAMVQVVERGTARSARIEGLKIAGKTGSAENPMGETHAWFACFAPADNPKILIVVIIENGGYGGKVAAPVAKEILEKTLAKEKLPRH